MSKLTVPQLDQAALELEHAPPQDILAHAVAHYGGRLALACSFDVHGVALIHMLAQGGHLDQTQVFYLDTGVLFPEILDLIPQVEAKYGFKAVAVKPLRTWEEQQADQGGHLYERGAEGVRSCCGLRKVEPLRRHLKNFDAWITGIARDQAPTRKHLPVVHFDDAFGLAKYNPLAAIDWNTLWGYVRGEGVPYCALYDQGYESIGCNTPVCTVKGAGRAGRWAGLGKTECGIHVDKKRVDD